MKPLIVANWKMNPPTLAEAKRLFDSVKKGIKNIKKAEVVICPPFPYILNFKSKVLNLKLGAQDCFWQEKGAYTGEVSPAMLKDLGVEYVILGHSERRKYFGESTELVNQKIITALRTGLKVIFCLGSETRKPGREIKYQLEKGLRKIKKADFSKLILVYEPVWAISTSKNKLVPVPKDVLTGNLFIRKVLEEMFSRKIALRARIIYGGSVDSKNIKGFLKEGKMMGSLVGAASLDPCEFVKIVKIAEEDKFLS